MEKTDDNLEQFFQKLRSNQSANKELFADWYAKIKSINDCFAIAGKNLIDPRPIISGILFSRCQYAFKTSAGMALAGQATEVFVMLRSVLEYTGYALAIFDDPTLENVWIERHVDPEKLKRQRDAFKISNVRDVIKKYDSKLKDIYDELYERTINFGGHPNPHAVFVSMRMDSEKGEPSLFSLAISSDPKSIQHALKSTAQVGFTALHIFQHIYKEKFELLGIREVIERLRSTGQI